MPNKTQLKSFFLHGLPANTDKFDKLTAEALELFKEKFKNQIVLDEFDGTATTYDDNGEFVSTDSLLNFSNERKKHFKNRIIFNEFFGTITVYDDNAEIVNVYRFSNFR